MPRTIPPAAVPSTRLKDNAVVPTRGSKYAAGADLYSAENDLYIEDRQTVMIGTGIAMEIPEGYVGLVYARSGLACKEGLAPANKVGVIDSDYRGEIKVALYNQSGQKKLVKKGERIAQIVIAPFLAPEFTEVSELDETDRGEGGFGSTGK